VSFEFTVSDVLPATPQQIYDAWLDSDRHAAMTGSDTARISPEVGATFMVWDDYIWGRNLELEPGRRIVQSWRTTSFGQDDPDSKIEVLLEPAAGGTRVTIHHTGVPDGHESYRDGGWQENYFDPMRIYFTEEARA
jgi:activator of HSP90 ATPase